MIELLRYARHWARLREDPPWLPWALVLLAVITGSVSEAKYALIESLIDPPGNETKKKTEGET